MKSGGNILLLFGAAGLIYFLSRKKTLAKTASFSFEKLGVDLKNKTIKLGIGVSNPTGATANLSAITGAFYLAGKQVASIESFERRQIAPHGKTILNIVVKPSLAGLWSNLKDIIKSGGKNVKGLKPYIEGVADIDGFNFPFKNTLS